MVGAGVEDGVEAGGGAGADGPGGAEACGRERFFIRMLRAGYFITNRKLTENGDGPERKWGRSYFSEIIRFPRFVFLFCQSCPESKGLFPRSFLFILWSEGITDRSYFRKIVISGTI
jgi:hypothetical protein